MVILAALSLLHSPANPLLKLADRIDQIKAIAFDYRRDLNYGTNGFKHSLSARMTIEFDKSWKPLGARYQAKSATLNERFDGVEYLSQAAAQTPVSKISPDAQYFESISMLKNSLIGLGQSLRAAEKVVLELKSSGETFSFELKERELAAVRPLEAVAYSPRYEITVDAKSGLPVKIVQFLKDRKDTITTRFSNYDLDPKPSW